MEGSRSRLNRADTHPARKIRLRCRARLRQLRRTPRRRPGAGSRVLRHPFQGNLSFEKQRSVPLNLQSVSKPRKPQPRKPHNGAYGRTRSALVARWGRVLPGSKAATSCTTSLVLRSQCCKTRSRVVSGLTNICGSRPVRPHEPRNTVRTWGSRPRFATIRQTRCGDDERPPEAARSDSRSLRSLGEAILRCFGCANGEPRNIRQRARESQDPRPRSGPEPLYVQVLVKRLEQE
jgi:hypothetical protein